MIDLEVIDDPAAAAAALTPIRAEILAALRDPGSASSLSTMLGVSRQKINYHLHALEAHGLVTFVEERPRRGLVERVVVASARAYVVSPDAIHHDATDPTRTDRFSSRYLIAIGARMVREVAHLARRADATRQPLATLTIDTEIRFASASDRAEFTAELTSAVTRLCAKYHDESSAGGRWHRLIAASYPHTRTRTPRTPVVPGEPDHV
jgi:DNA-binding transcriptional ArsR family regulator